MAPNFKGFEKMNKQEKRDAKDKENLQKLRAAWKAGKNPGFITLQIRVPCSDLNCAQAIETAHKWINTCYEQNDINYLTIEEKLSEQHPDIVEEYFDEIKEFGDDINE